MRWLVAPALLLVAGAVLWSNWPRDSVERASVGDALRDYRSRAGGVGAPDRGLPRPGVYVYSIAGGETLHALVFEGTHRYDGEATITVEPRPCGVAERWRPLDTRWTESRFCGRGGEFHLASISESHEFFGTSSLSSYRCRGAAPGLARARVGSSWKSACSGGSGTLRISSRVVAAGVVEVDGRRFAAVRIHSRAAVGGEQAGASVRSEWRRRSDGLLLRRSVSTEASVEVLGGGTYHEDYSLELLATAPRR